MNFLRIVLLIACVVPPTAVSSRNEPLELQRMLVWEDTNPPGAVIGYVIYQRIGVDWIVVGYTDKTSFEVALHSTVSTFAVSCYSSEGVESERSKEVNVPWPVKEPPCSPGGEC